jgi:hypothetical protein
VICLLAEADGDEETEAMALIHLARLDDGGIDARMVDLALGTDLG